MLQSIESQRVQSSGLWLSLGEETRGSTVLVKFYLLNRVGPWFFFTLVFTFSHNLETAPF